MASCAACGADITWAVTRDGEKIPLEKHTEPSGPNRWRVVEVSSPPVVSEAAANSMIDAYPDHRADCPGWGNGLDVGRR